MNAEVIILVCIAFAILFVAAYGRLCSEGHRLTQINTPDPET